MADTDFDAWFRSRFRRTSSAPAAIAFIFSDLVGVMLSFGWGFLLLEGFGWIVLRDSGFIELKSFVTYWPYLPAFVIIFQLFGLYPGISLAPSEELRRFSLGSAVAYGWVILSRLVEARGWDEVSWAFSASLLFSAMILLASRSAMHWILRRSGWRGIPAVVFGSGERARLAIDRMLQSRRVGYAPAAILDDEAPPDMLEYSGVPVIRDSSLGPRIARRHRIRMAVVAVDGSDPEKLRRLLSSSVSAFRYRVIIPDFFGSANIWMSVRDFDGLLGLASSQKLNMPWNLAIKRLMDVALVLVGGLVLLPALLVVALIVKLSSRGPVLYGHRRLGKDGRPFVAWKFRSMAVDAQERLEALLESSPEIRREWEESRKLKNDPRVTKFGKFMRRASIDEFPQFINILKGEMSLVGPRPITGEEVGKYGGDFDWIFQVRPGLTGLWQVSGRSEKDYATRVSYDAYYLQSWSAWLDIWVIYRTFGVVVRGKGAY